MRLAPFRSVRFVLPAPSAVSLLLLALGGASAAAQGLAVPTSHFGAIMYPVMEPVWELGFSADRFTEHTKPRETNDAERMREYVAGTTFGWNNFHLSRSVRVRQLAWILRLSLQGGWTDNQPTGYLQNEFRHGDIDTDFIPVTDLEKRPNWGTGVSVHRWFDLRILRGERVNLNSPLFLGFSATASTILNEAVVEGGLRSRRWIVGGVDLPSPSFMFRKGVRAARQAHLAPGSISKTFSHAAFSFQIPLDHWFQVSSFLPALEIQWSSSDGLFRGWHYRQVTLDSAAVDKSVPAHRIPERFCSFAAKWANGDFAIETYNDSCGNKDIGPSYGARIYVRWRRFG